MNQISQTKLKQYFDITRKALEKVKIPHKKGKKEYKNAHIFLDMATRYFKDAQHFQQKSDFVNVLLANLSQDDKDKYDKSREILNIMHRLHFSTPLVEYMHSGKDEKVKTEIRRIMVKEKEEKK